MVRKPRTNKATVDFARRQSTAGSCRGKMGESAVILKIHLLFRRKHNSCAALFAFFLMKRRCCATASHWGEPYLDSAA